MAKSPNPPSIAATLVDEAEEEEKEEEDDYLSMTITEPTAPPQKETYTQRRIRKQREAEEKARPKSKAELAALEASKRAAALSAALPTSSSKGFAMMARLGFKPGSALGKEGNAEARTEPLEINVKEDRGGVGLDSEKKRKFREEVEGVEKKAKVEEGDFRVRLASEREEKRCEGLWWGAMKVLEGLEEPEEAGQGAPTMMERRRKKRANVLYRALVRERIEKERERRARFDLLQSLSRDRKYEDPEEDEHDRQAWGREVEDGDEGEDEELEEFLALEPKERLGKVVWELREKWWYCFWCKSKYDSADMEGCPGAEEDDHD